MTTTTIDPVADLAAVLDLARCRRLGHKRHLLPGSIGCAECWESVIRAAEREHQHHASAASGACVTCGARYGGEVRSA